MTTKCIDSDYLLVTGTGALPAPANGEAGGAAAGKKLSRKERLRQSKARKSAAAQNNSDEEDTTTAGAPHVLSAEVLCQSIRVKLENIYYRVWFLMMLQLWTIYVT